MIPRERQLATIRHDIPDRISVDAIAIEPAPQLADFLGVDLDQLEDTLGIDGRIVMPPHRAAPPKRYTADFRAEYLANHPAEDEATVADDDPFALNEWGTPSKAGITYGGDRPYPLAYADTVAKIESYPWPDPAHYDYHLAAQTARQWAQTYAVRGPSWKPLFCQVCDLFGMEDTLVKMMAQPSLFEAALDQVFNFDMQYVARLLQACGDDLHILCLGDDFASQRGMIISPELWRKYLKPRWAALFEQGKKLGKIIWFHSCGDITPVLPDLLDIGMDVWETVQLHTLPIPPQQLKRDYGEHLTFFGAICTQHLPFATPQQVAQDVIHCIETLGKNGGYICGPDHIVEPDVPPANTVALFQTARAFSGSAYTQNFNNHKRFV